MDKEHRMMKAEILQGEGFKQREIAEMLSVTDIGLPGTRLYAFVMVLGYSRKPFVRLPFPK
jgi:hypothetical protein